MSDMENFEKEQEGPAGDGGVEQPASTEPPPPEPTPEPVGEGSESSTAEKE